MQEFKVDTKEAVKEMNLLIDKFVDFKNKVNGTADESKAGFRKIETSIIGLKKATAGLVKEYVKLDKKYKNVSKSQKSFVTQTRNLKNLLAKTKAQLIGVNAQLTKLKAKGASGIFTSIKSGVFSLIAAFGILSGVMLFTRAIQSAFALTTSLDSMSFSMKAVITDAVELAQTYTWLRQITNDFGAALITTTNRYIKFRAAAKSAGLTAKETQNIFGTFTKVSGVLGLKTEELTGIYLALEQMISKGKITTEELRRQLGERLPGAMDIMAAALKVNTAELDKMLKKGEVITKEVLPAFAEQVKKTFGLQSIKSVKTLQAATVRLGNSWVILIEDLKNGSGIAEKLTEIIDLLAKNLEDVAKAGWLAIKMYIAYRLALQYSAANTVLLTIVTRTLNGVYIRNIAALVAQKLATLAASAASWTLIGSLRVLWTTFLAHPLGIFLVVLGGLYWAFNRVNESVLENITSINELSGENLKNITTNTDLAQSLQILIDRYEELKKAKDKGELGADGLKELKSVVEEIGGTLPQAVKGFDQYGRSLGISAEKVKELIKEIQELSVAQAEVELDIQFANLKKGKNELDKLTNGLGVFIEGIGDVTIGVDGMAKSISRSGRSGAATLTELSKVEVALFKQWSIDTKKQIAISEIQIDQLGFLIEGTVLLNEEMKGDDDETAVIKNVQHYKDLIKVQKESLRVEALTRKEAIPHQKEIERLQGKIDEILGKKVRKGAKRITQLRIVKDLLRDIQNLQLQQQVIRLNIIADNPEAELDIIEDALINSALTQVGIARNTKDSILKINSDKFEKEKEKIEKEIALHKVGSDRRIELEEFLVVISDELRQKDLIAELKFANKIYDINNALQIKLENLRSTRDTDRVSAKTDDGNIQLIKLKETFELERRLSEQRIDVAQDVFDASEKTNKDLRQLEDVKNSEYKFQTDNFKKLEREKLEVVRKVAKEIFNLHLGTLQGELLGLDEDKDARKIKLIKQEINKLKVALEDLEKLKPEIKINVQLVKDTKLVGHIKDITSEIGNLVQAFSDARVETIEAEMERERNNYDKLIELARDDIRQKENLERERDAKIAILEKKRLKEEQKAAKIRKAFALADIAMNTAQAIMSIWANGKDFTGISQGILTALVATLGAVQTATVLATPVPQYAEGSKGEIKNAHVGMINDARNQEYITRDGNILTTKSKNALVKLEKGDVVHKDFTDLMKSTAILNPFSGGAQISERSFNHFFKGIQNSLDKGLKKAKFVNKININNGSDNYGRSLSKWSN